jgi:hypothetical protein
MKNIFLALLIVTLVLSVFPLAAHAEELPETTTETITETVETPTEETAPTEDITEPTENPTEAPTSPEEDAVASFLTRIQEAWEKGEIATVINLAFDAALLIFVAILKKSGGKNKVEMVTALKNTKDTTVKSVNDLITAANDVVNAVEGDGGMKSIINGFKDDVNRQIEEIKQIDKDKLEGYGKELESTMAAVKLLAEMLQTTYANSTTIPMSTKNIIGQKYVEICDLMKKETTNEQ